MRMYGAWWRNGGRSMRRRWRWRKRCAPCPAASRRGGNAGRTCRRTSPAGSIRNIPLTAPGARKAVHWRPWPRTCCTRKSVHAPLPGRRAEGQRAGIRQAAQEARDALQDDRCLAFGWLTDEVVRQAGETRTEAFHVPRYGEVVAQAKALSGQEALPAHTQEVVTSWLDYHAGCQSICRQIRELPARADALTADCPERPATLDSLRGWRQRAEPLLAEARAMPEKDGPHAPHLAAMPDERGALVKATSRLESALLAVEAEELRRDWHTHVSRAMTAHAHPFYVVGHAELIDRLQQLRNQPAVTALPASELEQIDSILGEDRRQTKAVSHVHNYLDKVERCRNDLKELRGLARTHKSRIEEVHSYDEWHDTAERLLATGKAIIDDHKTCGPCLNHTFHAWMDVHASIRELESALGHDTTSLRHQQPELYLQPITRPVPTLDEAKEADASYRRLRDQWHEHMALAETSELHPYEIQGYATLIDAMREIRDRPHLDATARNTLDTVLDQHLHIEQARTDIDRYLKDTARSFRSLENLKDVAERFSTHGVQLEEIGSYKEWKQRALELAASGKAMLADRQHYRIHLKENPDLAHRIHADVQHLNAAIGRDDTSISRERHQSPSEDEKTAERLSQRRGIKL